MTKFLKLWLPVIIWAIVIFQFSGSSTAPIEPTSLLNIVIRKLAHISEYAFFFYLLARALQTRKYIPYALALAIFYAFTDETHQLFTPDRTASLTDVFFFDLIGMIPLWFILNRFPKLLKWYV